MSELNRLLLPVMEGFSEWKNVRGMSEIQPDHMPQPYRDLLVHQRDMTGSLTQFFGESLHLKVLEKTYHPPILARRVLLVLDEKEMAVEYGAIRIHLDHYPAAARQRIREGLQPLGGILNDLKIPYLSRPQRFIQIEETNILKQVFQIQHRTILYGRCNFLMTPTGQSLAEIVEVLPPLNPQ